MSVLIQNKKFNKSNINKINIKKSQKFFTASIVFSLISPILFLILMYLQSIALNKGIDSVVFKNTGNTLMFTISMIQPFCAFIVIGSIKNIKNNINANISQVMIYLVLFAQVIVGNIISAVCLILGIFKIKSATHLFKDSLNEIKDASVKLNIITCIFLVLVSMFCAYVKMI